MDGVHQMMCTYHCPSFIRWLTIKIQNKKLCTKDRMLKWGFTGLLFALSVEEALRSEIIFLL